MNYLPAVLKVSVKDEDEVFVQIVCGESGSFVHFVNFEIVSSITENNRETQLCGLILLQNMSVSFQA